MDAGQTPSAKLTLNGFRERGTGGGRLSIPLLTFSMTARQEALMDSRRHPGREHVGKWWWCSEGGGFAARRDLSNFKTIAPTSAEI